jgi:tetratricopeptide (TPR) repeat protein
MNLTNRFATAMIALLCVLACAACSGPADAADLTREQALKQLSSKDAAARLAAVSRLQVIGRARDGTALAKILFDEDDGNRSAAEAAMWSAWSRSGDAQIDMLFKKGVTQMNSGEPEAAAATFTEVIRKKPDFAEAWNKRATVYFFMKRFKESLADCDEVIKRNPVHFGVLSGYGQIYAQMEEFDKALDYFERAIAINPNMDGVAQNIVALRQLRAARARKAI